MYRNDDAHWAEVSRTTRMLADCRAARRAERRAARPPLRLRRRLRLRLALSLVRAGFRLADPMMVEHLFGID